MFILHADKNYLKIQEKEMITSGSVNVYTCRFIFNEDWDNLNKTAVFKCNETTIAVELLPVLDEDSKEYIFETNIPWEVMQEYGRTLYIGVRGTQGENLVLPTIWASVGTIKQGVLSADAGTDIPPNKYDELKADISKKGDTLEYNGIDLTLLSDGQIISTCPIVGNTGSGDITTGVLSFNGRTGRIVPEIGDYTAEMVGALPSTTSIPSMPEDIGADPAGAGETAAEKVKEEIIENLDNKLDNTGGTVTGEIVFTDVSISLQRDANETNETIVDSTGIHYNGTGVLQIENNGVSVIDEIKSEIPKRVSQLENDSGYITKEDQSTLSIQDQNTEDGWHIRKWSDGYVEMQIRQTVSVPSSKWNAWLNTFASAASALPCLPYPLELEVFYSETDTEAGDSPFFKFFRSNGESTRECKTFDIVRGLPAPTVEMRFSLDRKICGRWK